MANGKIFFKKYLILSLVFVVLLFSISSIWASDLANDTDLNLSSDNDNIIKVYEDDKKQMDVDLIVDENTIFYSEKEGHISVNVHDKEGYNVTVGTVTFLGVFGHNYTSDVLEGIAESLFQIEDVGQYNITCFYDGNGVYNNATTTFLLTIAIEETACHNLIATRYDDIVYFAGNIITIYEDEIGEVDEGTVSIYVNDKKVGVCGVDSRGNFAYIWKSSKNLIGKTINVTIEYTNDLNHYNSSKLSKIFSFKAPKDTTIISNVKQVDNNRKLVTGIIKDKDGNAVVGGTLNINNLYSIPVDSNGKYGFYVTKSNNEKKVNYEIGYFN